MPEEKEMCLFTSSWIWQRVGRRLSRPDPLERLRRKLQLLEDLHSDVPFTEMTSFSSTTLPPFVIQQVKGHINSDWFGEKDPAGSVITGVWAGWKGNAEAIVRETLVRAVEASLGLDHRPRNPQSPVTLGDYGLHPPDTALPEEVRRNWTIEFWEVAPAPFMEASITWRHMPDDPLQGSVMVIWHVPGAGKGTPSNFGTSAAQLEPTSADGRLGSWLVSQRRHEVEPFDSWQPSERGNWPRPLTVVRSHDEVVTLSPAPVQGGIDPELL